MTGLEAPTATTSREARHDQRPATGPEDLFPAAVATAVFWLGMEAVFSVIFSGMVTSYDTKYGPIGVVFALMSWLVAIGVVIILGAVAGIVWQERNLSFRAAARKFRRDRSTPQTRRP